MMEWERKELELLRKENAWLDTVHPLMKLVDNPWIFFVALAVVNILAFGLGLLLSLIL